MDTLDLFIQDSYCISPINGHQDHIVPFISPEEGVCKGLLHSWSVVWIFSDHALDEIFRYIIIQMFQ